MVKETKRETIAKWLYVQFGFDFYGADGEPSWCSEQEKGGDCGELNRKAAKELWETEKYVIDDWGGDYLKFGLTEHGKEQWRLKADDVINLLKKRYVNSLPKKK